METNFAADIPLSRAIAAHQGTSWVPDERGKQRVKEYVSLMQGDLDSLRKACNGDEHKLGILEEEFERYRTGYRTRYLSYLDRQSRVMSTFITGASKFPVRSNEKKVRSSDRAMQELIDFRKRALKAINKKLFPERGPIWSSNSDATDLLREKIEKAEKLQEAMKSANRIVRAKPKNEYTDEKAEKLRAIGISERNISELFKPDFCGRFGFPDYALKNNNANIRRMKQRVVQIERDQSRESVEYEAGDGIRIEDCPAENRVRIFFPGKPEASVRSDLKRHGFRWAPSLGCWQAYRNFNSTAYLKSAFGKLS